MDNAPLRPRAPGDPLPGLTPAQTSEFQAGREDFLEVEDEADGLGPSYNGTSCAACHNLPGVGGAGNTAVIRAGRLENGVFTSPTGTNLIHLFSTPEHGCQPQIPADANVVIRRIPHSDVRRGPVGSDSRCNHPRRRRSDRSQR